MRPPHRRPERLVQEFSTFEHLLRASACVAEVFGLGVELKDQPKSRPLGGL